MFDFSFLDEKTVIVGFLEKHPQNAIINQLLLIAKRCIYVSINKEKKPSMECFKMMLFASHKDEKYIASRKSKLSFQMGHCHWCHNIKHKLAPQYLCPEITLA